MWPQWLTAWLCQNISCKDWLNRWVCWPESGSLWLYRKCKNSTKTVELDFTNSLRNQRFLRCKRFYRSWDWTHWGYNLMPWPLWHRRGHPGQRLFYHWQICWERNHRKNCWTVRPVPDAEYWYDLGHALRSWLNWSLSSLQETLQALHIGHNEKCERVRYWHIAEDSFTISWEGSLGAEWLPCSIWDTRAKCHE